MSRSFVEIAPSSDPWPTIDAWASASGMKLVAHGPWGRTYSRGDGFWSAKIFTHIEVTSRSLVIQGWMVFWMTGQELEIHSPTPLQYFPRKKARKIVNRLLVMLGVPELNANSLTLP